MSKEKEQPTGVITSSYSINEYQIQSMLILTISDAKKLCETTKTGLPKNRELREYIFEQLLGDIKKAVDTTTTKREKGRE